jgi:hypothetical protein
MGMEKWVGRFSLALGLALAGGGQAAEVYFPPSIPMPANITEQYQIQGEYYGNIVGGGALGAWVVAKGNNQYDVKYLPGGLVSIPNAPGGGWDKVTKYEVANVASTAFNTSNGYKGTVSGTGENRTITGTTNDNKAFTLTRQIRKSPTENLQPKAEWNAKFWFRENTAADLTNWSGSPAPSMKHGGGLYRGVTSKNTHATVFLHIEIKQAFSPLGRDQIRSNSGVYLKNMHEMQILDSFGLTGAPNEMGGIYGVKAPLVNAALPPLNWQTYDIYYTPTGGNSATITAYLNGVLVQNNSTVTIVTEGGSAGNSIYLQNHDAASEVVFRNIWAIDNATTTTLPWSSVLPPDTTPVVYLRSGRNIKIKKSAREFWMEKMLGRDLIGRKGPELPELFK